MIINSKTSVVFLRGAKTKKKTGAQVERFMSKKAIAQWSVSIIKFCHAIEIKFAFAQAPNFQIAFRILSSDNFSVFCLLTWLVFLKVAH